VVGTGSGRYPMADCGISGVEATELAVWKLYKHSYVTYLLV
jgi:hypothetical protein